MGRGKEKGERKRERGGVEGRGEGRKVNGKQKKSVQSKKSPALSSSSY